MTQKDKFWWIHDTDKMGIHLFERLFVMHYAKTQSPFIGINKKILHNTMGNEK